MDKIIRATAADGYVKMAVITARDTVERARQIHDLSPTACAALGRTLCGASLLGQAMKEEKATLTIRINGGGPIGSVVAVSDCEGSVRGYVENPHCELPLRGDGKLDVGGAVGAGTLSVVHDLPRTEPYMSQVELVSGEIGDDLTSYFVMSDQIPTSVGLGVLVDRDLSVKQAGGFIIQLMPRHYAHLVDDLEANLSDVDSVTAMLDTGMGPTEMLQHLLRGMEFEVLETRPVSFHCGCNTERAARVMLALGAEDLQDMIDKGETAEAYCHFCSKRHTFTPDQLRELLAAARG